MLSVDIINGTLNDAVITCNYMHVDVCRVPDVYLPCINVALIFPPPHY